jgi:hypothetical protein
VRHHQYQRVGEVRADGPVDRGEFPVARQAQVKDHRPEAADQVGQQGAPRVPRGVAPGVHDHLNLLKARLAEQLGQAAAEPQVGAGPAEA